MVVLVERALHTAVPIIQKYSIVVFYVDARFMNIFIIIILQAVFIIRNLMIRKGYSLNVLTHLHSYER